MKSRGFLEFFAADVLSSGGVIFLDDYYNPGWPGVHEGFIRYMGNFNKKLAPFAYHANKLMLCDISHHGIYLKNFHKEITSIEGFQAKVVEMSGFRSVWVKDE